MLRILAAIAVLVMFASLVPAAFADTTLTLYRIPGSVYVGEFVTFTGVLHSDGRPLAGKTVWIQDEDSNGRDDNLKSGTTDRNGRFSITWKAFQSDPTKTIEIRAVFEGDSSYGRDTSPIQKMVVFERRSTQVILYSIPDAVYAGNSVTFTGTLTHGGHPLAGKKIWMQDEDSNGSDDNLKSGTTDRNGRFSITWVADRTDSDGRLEIRAVFEGDPSYGRDTSPIQKMRVVKIGGDITLDPFPRTAKVGQAVTFSGTLSLNHGSPAGAAVYIKDEDSNDWDDLLVTAYVESNGRFSATWIAERTDPNDTLEIFAVFEGDKGHYRQATCGDGCGDTIPLRISGRVDSTPPVVRPPAPGGQGVPDGARYMEMFYALDLRGSPHVAIVPDPDTYDKVRSHITPVKEGILTWVDALKREYRGGNWDPTFEVVKPGDRFDSRPDVVMNIVTNKRDDKCGVDYAGLAWVYKSTPTEPVQTTVCSTSQGEKRSNQNVASTAGHEFMHAMGLGHAFNKPGDVMCSREDTGPTCDLSVRRSSDPSSLNLGAVAQMYGADGFTNPNNFVAYKDRFAEGSTGASPNVQSPTTQRQTAQPQTRTQSFPNGCTTDDKSYNITLKNYELKPGRYAWYTICNTGTVQYSFATTDRDAGFSLYVLPPAADVREYVNNDRGHPSPCEDTDRRWFGKSNSCYLRVGSFIVLHNDRDVSITINGHVTTDVRKQSFPNNCTKDDANYDSTKTVRLNSGAFISYTICNTGTVQYSFSTATSDTGFKMYVLPPETDVRGFVNDGRGYYSTCEDPNDVWHSKSNTCNVAVGSRIVLHNDGTVPITINGSIRT